MLTFAKGERPNEESQCSEQPETALSPIIRQRALPNASYSSA